MTHSVTRLQASSLTPPCHASPGPQPLPHHVTHHQASNLTSPHLTMSRVTRPPTSPSPCHVSPGPQPLLTMSRVTRPPTSSHHVTRHPGPQSHPAMSARPRAALPHHVACICSGYICIEFEPTSERHDIQVHHFKPPSLSRCCIPKASGNRREV